MKKWIVGLMVLGACSSSGYPESFKTSFMDNCDRTSGGQVAYCGCALNYLEDNVPYEDAESRMFEAVGACRGEL